MSRNIRIGIIGIMLTLNLLPAAANPYYVGFSLGWSSADEDCDYNYNCDGNDTSFKFYGGSKFHENFAVEVSYQDLGLLTNKGSTITSTAESSGINVSLLGIIPVMEVLDLYGKMGWMVWDTDYARFGAINDTLADDGTDFTFGAGLSWRLEDKYQLRMEFERLNKLGNEYTTGGANISVWSFGGAIHF